MGSKKNEYTKKINKKSRDKNKGERTNPSLVMESTGSHDREKKKIITDARFSSVHSDPRFQNVPKHKAKVAIDSRFDRMFSDKRFSSSNVPLDKRGKVKKHNSANSLRHYYKSEEEEREKDEGVSEEDVEGDEEEEDGDDTIVNDVGGENNNGILEKPDSSNESEDSESEDDIQETVQSDYTTDTDEGELEEIYDDETPGLPVENIPEIDKETRRLAIVNLDWRHVKASDLYVVLSSFLPKGGQILSVAVYPSEFGLQRMKEEELHGPVGLFDDDQEKNDEDDDEEEIDTEKLRAYEMSRLRYYYAVVECDSIATADYLYKSCDGVEFERSSNVIDLRFIPDSMEFVHPPRDIATEAPSSYEALNFHTPALQHSKLHLSWDEDEPQRVRALKRKYNADQLAEMEFKEFLASDKSESDDENDDGEYDETDKNRRKGDKYRALLQSEEDGEQDDQDMEVTFNTGLEDISKRILEKKDKKSETVWEAYLRKKREKKKARKSKSTNSSDDESSDTDREVAEEADDFFVEEPSIKSKKDGSKITKAKEAEASRAELELLLADDQGVSTGVKGYNLKHKKAQKKNGKEVCKDVKVDYDDPRFSNLFKSHHHALDPTDPQFKRTLEQHIGNPDEFMKRQYAMCPTKQFTAGEDEAAEEEAPVNAEDSMSKKERLEMSSLVKSIKLKSKQLQLASSGKRPKQEGKEHSKRTDEKEEKHQHPGIIKSVSKKKQRKTRKTED